MEFEKGWEIIQTEITKQINILEDIPESRMDANLYMTVYTKVYSMCTKPPDALDNSIELYHRYRGFHNNYLLSKVLPAIQEKKQHGDVFLLQELVKRWANYKVIVSKLRPYFEYLDRYYIRRLMLPTLKGVAIKCFRKTVYEELKVQVKDIVISLINQEREGGEIDQTLVKNVLQIFVDLGNEDDGKQNMEYYINDFETAFLEDTADYYTRKASNWTKEDYPVKPQEFLQKEKDRVSRYLHSSTEKKLLKIFQD
ncbi:hypothetical protein MKW92_033954, partial [Papaver armeniacum]